MTIAEIHGKISSTGKNLHDQMEDLLTGNVFTVCKYVRPENFLIPFLKTAKTPKGETLDDFLPQNIKTVDYEFWPRLATCEPDVLIAIQDHEGKYALILIEAKYMSTKSSTAYDEKELEIAETPRDQLAREYADLNNAHEVFNINPKNIAHRHLIYLTANRSLPKKEIRESINEIIQLDNENDDPEIYWASWFNISTILKNQISLLEYEKPILDDLLRLLKKKNLIWFEGFSEPKTIQLIKNSIFYQSLIIASRGLEDRTTKEPKNYIWQSRTPILNKSFYKGNEK